MWTFVVFALVASSALVQSSPLDALNSTIFQLAESSKGNVTNGAAGNVTDGAESTFDMMNERILSFLDMMGNLTNTETPIGNQNASGVSNTTNHGIEIMMSNEFDLMINKMIENAEQDGDNTDQLELILEATDGDVQLAQVDFELENNNTDTGNATEESGAGPIVGSGAEPIVGSGAEPIVGSGAEPIVGSVAVPIAEEADEVAEETDEVADEADEVADEADEVADEDDEVADEADEVADEDDEVADEADEVAEEADEVVDKREDESSDVTPSYYDEDDEDDEEPYGIFFYNKNGEKRDIMGNDW